MKKLIFALLMFLTPTAASAYTEYATHGGWLVGKSDSTCTLAAQFGNDAMLYLDYDQRLKTVILAFSDPSVKALKDGDKRKLNTYFLKGDHFDDGWADKEFTVIEINGTRFFTRTLNEQFLTDLASNQMLGFFYGEVLLQRFDLDGSAIAVKSLRECALKQMWSNPSDPFAGEK